MYAQKMKISTFFIFFIAFLTTSITAQETIWLDVNRNSTIQEKATYYRPAPKKVENGFWLVDYFTDGVKQMEGFSTVKNLGKEQFDGLVTYYYKSGNIFKEIHYEKGKRQGIQKTYYPTEEVKEMGVFDEGQKDGVWKTFYKNGKIETKGKYRDGEKVGVWKTFYKNVY